MLKTNDKKKIRSEIQRFFSNNSIKLIEGKEGVIKFEKGSVWGYSPKTILIQGKLRFQQIDEMNSCSIVFSRTKAYMYNAGFGIGMAILIILGLVLYHDQLLTYSIIWNVGWLVFLDVLVLFVIFLEFYIIEAAEQKFIDLFEFWFEPYF